MSGIEVYMGIDTLKVKIFSLKRVMVHSQSHERINESKLSFWNCMEGPLARATVSRNLSDAELIKLMVERSVPSSACAELLRKCAIQNIYYI